MINPNNSSNNNSIKTCRMKQHNIVCVDISSNHPEIKKDNRGNKNKMSIFQSTI